MPYDRTSAPALAREFRPARGHRAAARGAIAATLERAQRTVERSSSLHCTTGQPDSTSSATVRSRSIIHIRRARLPVDVSLIRQRVRRERVDYDHGLAALPKPGDQRRHPLIEQRCEGEHGRPWWGEGGDPIGDPGLTDLGHPRVEQPVAGDHEVAAPGQPPQKPQPGADVDQAHSVASAQVVRGHGGGRADRRVEAARGPADAAGLTDILRRVDEHDDLARPLREGVDHLEASRSLAHPPVDPAQPVAVHERSDAGEVDPVAADQRTVRAGRGDRVRKRGVGPEALDRTGGR